MLSDYPPGPSAGPKMAAHNNLCCSELIWHPRHVCNSCTFARAWFLNPGVVPATCQHHTLNNNNAYVWGLRRFRSLSPWLSPHSVFHPLVSLKFNLLFICQLFFSICSCRGGFVYLTFLTLPSRFNIKWLWGDSRKGWKRNCSSKLRCARWPTHFVRRQEADSRHPESTGVKLWRTNYGIWVPTGLPPRAPPKPRQSAGGFL